MTSKIKANPKEKDPLKLEDAKGLGPASIKVINEELIFDTVSLVCKSATWLKNVTGMERDRAKRIIRGIKTTLIEKGIIPKDDLSGRESFEYRKTLPRLKLGCEAVDDLLNGGIETECITQFFGMKGVGKTQTAHTLTVQALSPKKDGGFAEEGKQKPTVLFLDTEGTFRPERIIEIALAKKYVSNEEEALNMLDNVIVRNCYSADDLHQKIQESMSQIKDLNIRLIILDSATALFRSEYVGRGEGYAKFGLINEMLHDLKGIASNFRLPIVFINQVYHEPDSNFGDPDRPFGGNVIGHATPYIIHLKPSGKEKRIARLYKSPYQSNDDAFYCVTAKGITDFEAKPTKTKEDES